MAAQTAQRTGNMVALQNRCGESKSPYVRSHMSNPTAWQLWSPATLELARQTNRLLFVSIGYSACHWCHVMAHESFDDPRIAQLLNENFIPIKIDREERPDIDRQYMDFLQATSGGGGWPLNVFVTPELGPIYGGTYWPGPHSERAKLGGGATFEQILLKVAQAWKEQEQRCRQSAAVITQQLKQFAQEGTLSGGADGRATDNGDDGLELDLLEEAYEHYKGRYDPKYGGFGSAPKFPTPVHLQAMLRMGQYGSTVKDVAGENECGFAQKMATITMEHMAKGGIKDQIGHGFARYSVTREWSLPHFEKMLYDNAQLLPLYLDAYLLTKSALFLETVHDIATYLITEPIHSSTGGFHASEDADSQPAASDHEKREGAFYVWTMDEFRQILTEQEAQICLKHWNVKEEGNVDQRFDAQGELIGQNTLCIQIETAELSREFGISEDSIRQVLASGRQKLQDHRDEHRPRPALDDKIVVSWNGLAIGGLAKTSAALRDTVPDFSRQCLAAAEKAANFIHRELYDSNNNTLRRVYREGPGETQGFADDYAFLISGLIDLYEATFNDQYLQFADTLQKTQIKLFHDPFDGAFFSTPENQADILVRVKDAMDNAEPSTNGVSASNLFRLSSLLNDPAYETMARKTVAAFEVEIAQHPGLFSGMMPSVVATRLGMKSLLLVGAGQEVDAAAIAAAKAVRPTCTVLKVGGEAKSDWLRQRNELLTDLDSSRHMIQLCEGQACRMLEGGELHGLLYS